MKFDISIALLCGCALRFVMTSQDSNRFLSVFIVWMFLLMFAAAYSQIFSSDR